MFPSSCASGYLLTLPWCSPLTPQSQGLALAGLKQQHEGLAHISSQQERAVATAAFSQSSGARPPVSHLTVGSSRAPNPLHPMPDHPQAPGQGWANLVHLQHQWISFNIITSSRPQEGGEGLGGRESLPSAAPTHSSPKANHLRAVEP